MKIYEVIAGNNMRHTYLVVTDDPRKIYDYNFDFNSIIEVKCLGNAVVLK